MYRVYSVYSNRLTKGLKVSNKDRKTHRLYRTLWAEYKDTEDTRVINFIAYQLGYIKGE